MLARNCLNRSCFYNEDYCQRSLRRGLYPDSRALPNRVANHRNVDYPDIQQARVGGHSVLNDLVHVERHTPTDHVCIRRSHWNRSNLYCARDVW